MRGSPQEDWNATEVEVRSDTIGTYLGERAMSRGENIVCGAWCISYAIIPELSAWPFSEPAETTVSRSSYCSKQCWQRGAHRLSERHGHGYEHEEHGAEGDRDGNERDCHQKCQPQGHEASVAGRRSVQ